jgi:hypothetical protein
MVVEQGVTPDPESGDTGGVTGDPLVDDLAGQGAESAGGVVEPGSNPDNNQAPDLSELDPETVTIQELLKKVSQTNDFASRTATNLETSREEVKRLQEENKALRDGEGLPAGKESESRIEYAPEANVQGDFYDEDAMVAFMSAKDPNWEQMKGDDVYMGQNRAYFSALMNALGKMGTEQAATQRQLKMQAYGVTQGEIESFLNVKEFSHLKGMPIDHIMDVMRGIQKFAGGQEPTRPEGGVQPTPPGGARESVRRDPRHHQDSRRSIGTGTLTPDQEIHAALDAGDRDKGRALARDLFFAMGDRAQ